MRAAFLPVGRTAAVEIAGQPKTCGGFRRRWKQPERRPRQDDPFIVKTPTVMRALIASHQATDTTEQAGVHNDTDERPLFGHDHIEDNSH
jgi:hypothetical protein